MSEIQHPPWGVEIFLYETRDGEFRATIRRIGEKPRDMKGPELHRAVQALWDDYVDHVKGHR